MLVAQTGSTRGTLNSERDNEACGTRLWGTLKSAVEEVCLHMSKAMTIAGMVVAALVFLLFGLDLALGLPFGGAASTMNIGALVASAILGYLSFSTFREVK